MKKRTKDKIEVIVKGKLIPFMIIFIIIFGLDRTPFKNLGFGIILITCGIISTIFNKQLYAYMVKLNEWGFKKLRKPEYEGATKSKFYKNFYRITTFIVGLVLLILGTFYILLHFDIDLFSLFSL